MFCPVCKAEYRPGFTQCSGCGVALVQALAAADEETPRNIHWLAYALPLVACTCLVAIPTLASYRRSNYAVIVFFLLIFATNIGGFWTIYQALRYEERPLKYLLIALIPFSFFWYLMARQRPGRSPAGLLDQIPRGAPASVPGRASSSAPPPPSLLSWLPALICCVVLVAVAVFPSLMNFTFFAILVFLLIAGTNIGTLWMLYRSIRHEQRPLRYCLLALFVPFSFVWYAIARYRTLERSMAFMDRPRSAQ